MTIEVLAFMLSTPSTVARFGTAAARDRASFNMYHILLHNPKRTTNQNERDNNVT